MPIAAVPRYLGQEFSSTSPGLRFGMYLPIWTDRQTQEADVRKRAESKSREGDEVRALLDNGMDYTVAALQKRERKPLAGLWAKNDFAANKAWIDICTLGKGDMALMHGLSKRQTQSAQSIAAAQCLSINATAIAPFTTGLGNEHPLENGFSFLNPYGLPYLPGSGVKGVLRQAASELASGQWGETCWSADKRHLYQRSNGKTQLQMSDADVLFGMESADSDSEHLRGVLSFWDVIPQIKGDKLLVEIMTPHQSHYYQNKAHAGSNSPHESGSPTPISFLTVPPESGFTFHVVCDLPRLQLLAPKLSDNDRWKDLLTEAFEHAFAWLGFGAKTAVGYGAMARDSKAEAKAQQEAQAAAKAATEQQQRASMNPQQLQIADFVQACEKRLAELGGKSKDKPNTSIHSLAQKLSKAAQECSDWSANDKKAAAEAIARWLPQLVHIEMKDERKKLKLAVLRGES